VLDGEGPPLVEQRAEIEALFASAVDGTRYLLPLHDEVKLEPERPLAWADASRLLDGVAQALESPGTLSERVCRAGALVALTMARMGEGLAAPAALEAARAGRDELVREVLAEPPEVDKLSQAMFRTLLTSTEPGRGAIGRIGGTLALLFGGGEVRLRAGDGSEGGRVAARKIAAVKAGLSPDGMALLSRWLADGVRALTFFGEPAFGLPIAGGLDLKVLSAAVAIYLARANAAANGRAEVSLEDLKRGLRQLEAGLTHRGAMPPGFDRALSATASLDLLREQLEGTA
jgi:hypothetical protein